MRGHFITFEGPEGAGKSSVCKAVIAAFNEDILLVREPGSTNIGEKIRNILLTENMPPVAELMLFEAARTCIVEKVISPALNSGRHVLCDRFYDSSTAYQGYGRGISPLSVQSLNNIATGGLTPELTILFDIDPEKGMLRKGKATDVIESAGMEFHKRVRHGFLKIAWEQPERFIIVDASMPLDEVIEQVLGIMAIRFGWRLKN